MSTSSSSASSTQKNGGTSGTAPLSPKRKAKHTTKTTHTRTKSSGEHRVESDRAHAEAERLRQANEASLVEPLSTGASLSKLARSPVSSGVVPSLAPLLVQSTVEEAKAAAESAASMRQNDVVLLDVGGHKFKTTRSTLTKFSDTFFVRPALLCAGLTAVQSSLFSGQYDVPLQEDHSVFVDRDGTHFRRILNFLRCGSLVWPDDSQARRELWLEASFYGLDRLIMQTEEADETSEDPDETVWRSNVIFIGSQNIDFNSTDPVARRACHTLRDVQCPSTSEMVWKSIHDPGLTVIFQIINDESSDFSLAGVGRVLAVLERWRRQHLRFVLVYDAELIRELLKLSGEPFNNSSYIWYFTKGRLIESGVQWKLRYVGENIWRHYYLGALQDK